MPPKPRRGGPITRLGALRIVDPALWEALVREALAAEDGCVASAARRLGVGQRHLWRWIAATPALQSLRSHDTRVMVAK